MSQLVQDDRKLVGAHVGAEMRGQLLALAREEDRSLASIVRRALARELEHAHNETEARP